MAQEQGLDDRIALTAEKIRAGKTSLGIEFGSTRIKAVLIDDTYTTIAAGDYGWASHLEDGLWSYSQEEIWTGLQTAYAALAEDVENAYGEKLTREEWKDLITVLVNQTQDQEQKSAPGINGGRVYFGVRTSKSSKRYMVDRAKIVALAEKAGITPRMVEMVAHGQRRLSATSAEAVLRALGHD